ncbi:MAG: hypothetical protein AAB531_04475 [Patescibacteria group bacterium]
MTKRGSIEAPSSGDFKGYVEGNDNYPNFVRVEEPTTFQQIVEGLAQGCLNPNWRLDHLREWNEMSWGRRSNLGLVTVFENMGASKGSRLDLGEAFIPELEDIFDEHHRYLDTNRIRREKFNGVYNLSRMVEEAQDAVSAFNVDMETIEAHNSSRHGNKLVFVKFGITDLDKQYEELGRQITGIEEHREKIQERLRGERTR